MQVDGSVLVRKMRQNGLARSPLADTALIGEAFARQAEDRLRPVVKVPLSFSVRECRVSRLGEATAEIGTPAMIGLMGLERSETGALVALDSSLAWHLTDLTLGGDPDLPARVTVRSFTAIDVALGRLHLQPMIEALNEALGAALGRPLPVALTLEEQRQAISQVRIAPDYVDALKLRVEVEVGDISRQGIVDIVIPLATIDVLRSAIAREGAAEARDRPDDLWRSAMRRAAASAQIRLDAVIHRERMTLAAVGRLRPGDVIEIDQGAPKSVALTLGQPDGRVATIALGRLGGYEDVKVLRIRSEPEPRLAAQLRRALAVPGTSLASPDAVASLPAPDAPDVAPPPPAARETALPPHAEASLEAALPDQGAS
jgi:flagellar motor switch protein FliM